MDAQPILDLYNENSSILEETDNEVDLASYAYQIWQNAIDADPKLKKTVEELPIVVFSRKPHKPTPDQPDGVLVYMRTAEGNDSLAWINCEGTPGGQYFTGLCDPELHSAITCRFQVGVIDLCLQTALSCVRSHITRFRLDDLRTLSINRGL